MTTTPPVSLSSVERTEIKWALRSRNALARYLNWLSLRVPWAWRIRLDLVVLGNVLLGLGVWAAVAQVPTEPKGENFYLSGSVAYLYLGFTLAALAVGFFWAFTVTKSVRARAAPKLGPEPRILTAIIVCASFGFWLAVAGAAPYFGMQRSLGSGEYDQTTFVPPQPRDGESATALPMDQARIDELTGVVRANRRAGKLWDTLWGRDVHDFWIGYRYADGRPEAVSWALAYIEATPRWRDDPELQRWSAASSRSVLAYPGLVEAFKESPYYRSALINWFSRNDISLRQSQAYQEKLAELTARLPRQLARYRASTSSGDDTLVRYTEALTRWMADAQPNQFAELRRNNAVIQDYRVREVYLTPEERQAYDAAILEQHAILGSAEAFAAFQQGYRFSSFVEDELYREISSGLHHDSIRAEPSFHRLSSAIETAGDPATAIPEHGVRVSLRDYGWLTACAMIMIGALLLAVFVTSMNRVGLGATLGSVCVAVVLGIAVGVAAGIIVNAPRAEGAPPRSDFYEIQIWGTAALITLLPPLIFPIRDALTGVRRRWSRAMGLVSVWGSVAWFGLIVAAIGSTQEAMAKVPLPNDLAAGIVLGALWLVAFAIFAKLVFALIGRISSYPQPS